MPVIVVGADTPEGGQIVDGFLASPDREIRAFVSDETVAVQLRERGIKVALGDVSDDSHVEAAVTNCHTAVLVASAAADSRERSFAETGTQVVEGWLRAVRNVPRVIWVSDSAPAEAALVVSASHPQLAALVVDLDSAAD